MESKQVDHVYNEIALQPLLKHPFLVSARPLTSQAVSKAVQQDERSLYILMDFVEGGELFKLVQSKRKLEPSFARFYAAQIVLCFEYLHDIGLVYRDLKPENVLISHTGYAKLTDFGFLKKLHPGERTYTLCGTPEYLAPEVILSKGHAKAVDWYCLGVFIYELLAGHCPFMHEDPMAIFQMILKDRIRFPKHFDSASKSIVRHLTEHDLSRRFGNLKNGVEDVKNHRFFNEVNFYSVITMSAKAPFVPALDPLRKASIKRMKGQTAKFVEENQDNSYAPPIKPGEDPFLNWF